MTTELAVQVWLSRNAKTPVHAARTIVSHEVRLFGAMAEQKSDYGGAFWARNLEEVDREVARLAVICKVRILDPGVIERVLQNDESVCGTKNPAAFEKLRNTLMMHYKVRDQAVDAMGEPLTQQVMAELIERLRKRIGKQLGGQAP